MEAAVVDPLGGPARVACGDKKGTAAGYLRHRRAKEQSCLECRNAHTDYRLNRRHLEEAKKKSSSWR